MKSLCDLFKVKHTEFFNSSSLFVCFFFVSLLLNLKG